MDRQCPWLGRKLGAMKNEEDGNAVKEAAVAPRPERERRSVAGFDGGTSWVMSTGWDLRMSKAGGKPYKKLKGNAGEPSARHAARADAENSGRRRSADPTLETITAPGGSGRFRPVLAQVVDYQRKKFSQIKRHGPSMSMVPFYDGGREGEDGTGSSGRAARRCARGRSLVGLAAKRRLFAGGVRLLGPR